MGEEFILTCISALSLDQKLLDVKLISISVFLHGINQLWTDPFFFEYQLGIYNEDFAFFDASGVWVFDGNCVFGTIWIYVPCKALIPR